jgi:hypothetical protein
VGETTNTAIRPSGAVSLAPITPPEFTRPEVAEVLVAAGRSR